MSVATARSGYAQAGTAWEDGPMLAYGPLARHLLQSCPVPISGATVLDAGDHRGRRVAKPGEVVAIEGDAGGGSRA